MYVEHDRLQKLIYHIFVFQKNKLKFEAVPTENGPYCKGKDRHNSEINFEPESYTPSDNGNMLIDDKKTHYYQKYSDFLTKDQASNTVTLDNEDKNKVLEMTILGLESPHLPDNGNMRTRYSHNILTKAQASNIVTLDNEDKKKVLETPILELDSTRLQDKYGAVDVNVAELQLLNSTSYKQTSDINRQIATTTDYEKRATTVGEILPVDFEKIDLTPKSPNKNRNATRRNKKITILENKEVDFKFLTALPETEDIKLSKCVNGLQLMGDIKPLQPVTDLRITDVIPSQSVTDVQITDIKSLQSATNPLITEDVKQIVTTSQETEHDKPIKRITRAIKSAQQLVNKSNIESRLQQLENKLMSALNRNTQELGEVRKLVEKNGNTQKATRSCTRSFGTQTKPSEEQEKRYHYNQLSRFLSTETKSVLYEALFLSKYDIETNTPRPKRRKCIL